MKESLLLDSGFSLNIWVKAMDTASYLQNRLSAKSQKREIITEKT